MPVKFYVHPVTGDRVEFDAFETDELGPGGRACVAPWFARFIQDKIENDVRHKGTKLTCTSTMGCVRQFFIERLLAYGVNPQKQWLMNRGTALHKIAGASWPANWITEETDEEFCTVKGKLFGVELSALCDAIRVEGNRIVEIADCKFPSSYAARRNTWKEGKTKQDYVVQLNIQRLLLAQEQDKLKHMGLAGMEYDPDDVLLTIWDHADEFGGPKAFACRHMTEQEMLDYKPATETNKSAALTQEALTIGENVGWWQHGQALCDAAKITDEGDVNDPKEVATREQLANQLPLAGRMQYDGKKCSNYCDVSNICARLCRQYGEPE